MNFKKIRNEGRLLYEYIRGSHLYGLNTPQSDLDTGGVYFHDPNEFLGFKHYEPRVADAKSDNVWYEVGEFIKLLLKSNPTMMEGLFAPEDKIITPINPILVPLFENKKEFITKELFAPFYGFCRSQIIKCSGLNKKIVNPVNELLSPFDFIYTFKGQGSTKIGDWLKNKGLKQEYCGMVNIPNMHNMYGLYYDWGNHIQQEQCFNDDGSIAPGHEKFFSTLQKYMDCEYLRDAIKKAPNPIGYRGMFGPASKELRLSSIDDKNTKPLCFVFYNESGYSLHCKQYKDYQTWVKERNPARYESNLEKNYDSKNVMHCFRIMHMAKEIAMGEGFNLVRTWDKEFLMNVRNHKYEYEEIVEILGKESAEIEAEIKKSTIKDKINKDFINDLLVDIRKKQLKMQI